MKTPPSLCPCRGIRRGCSVAISSHLVSCREAREGALELVSFRWGDINDFCAWKDRGLETGDGGHREQNVTYVQ